MDVGKLITLAVANVFVFNFVLTRFLGLCPFFGVSGNMRGACGMSAAVTFVMVSSSAITWAIFRYLLIPFGLEYLRTICFILVIATFVQLTEMVLLKYVPALHRLLGVYLPLITTNCAVMGVAVLNSDQFLKPSVVHGSFVLSVWQGLWVGVGFTLALVLMAAMRERLDAAPAPSFMKGLPLAFVVGALLSLAFIGFAGFKI